MAAAERRRNAFTALKRACRRENVPRDRCAEHQRRKGCQQCFGQIVHIQRHGNHAFEHIARQRQHPAPESTVHKRIRRAGVFVLRSRRNFFMEHARKDLRIQHAAGKIS